MCLIKSILPSILQTPLLRMILQDFCILLSKGKQHTSTGTLRSVFPIKRMRFRKNFMAGVLQYYFIRVKTIEQKRNAITVSIFFKNCSISGRE